MGCNNTKERAFIFDMDGTLTPSKQIIHKDFYEFLFSFCESHSVYIVSGADYEQIVKQLGGEIISECDAIFPCSGNEERILGKVVFSEPWIPSERLINHLGAICEASEYPFKLGNHIELRMGMLNFSIVGRPASKENRRIYKAWDTEFKERQECALYLKENFNGLNAVVAGETGLDIFPKGKDKSQILKRFLSRETIYFGDNIHPQGNDYDIALKCNKYHCVKNWKDTQSILSAEYL